MPHIQDDYASLRRTVAQMLRSVQMRIKEEPAAVAAGNVDLRGLLTAAGGEVSPDVGDQIGPVLAAHPHRPGPVFTISGPTPGSCPRPSWPSSRRGPDAGAPSAGPPATTSVTISIARRCGYATRSPGDGADDSPPMSHAGCRRPRRPLVVLSDATCDVHTSSC